MWPRKVKSSCPVVASQIFAVLSPLAVTMVLPSGLYAVPRIHFVWPRKVRSRPVVESQTFRRLVETSSEDALAIWAVYSGGQPICMTTQS